MHSYGTENSHWRPPVFDPMNARCTLWSKAMLSSSWSMWEAGTCQVNLKRRTYERESNSQSDLLDLLQELALSSGGEEREELRQELVVGGGCSGLSSSHEFTEYPWNLVCIFTSSRFHSTGLQCLATLSPTESSAP